MAKRRGMGSTPKQHRRAAIMDTRAAREELRHGANFCNGAILAHQLATTAVVEALHARGSGPNQRLIEEARAVRDRAADRIRKHCGCKKGKR